MTQPDPAARITTWAYICLGRDLFDALIRTGPRGKRQALQIITDMARKIEEGKLVGLRANENRDTRRQAADEIKKGFAALLWQIERAGADIMLSGEAPPTAEYLEEALTISEDIEKATFITPPEDVGKP